MSGYTPTTEEVRKAWADWVATDWLATEQFDRWLEEYTRKKQVQAWDEGCKTGFANARTDNTFVIPVNPYRQGENK